MMTRRSASGFVAALALALLVACSDQYPASPSVPPASADRLLAAVDSANAAIHDLYRDGGKVLYLSLLVFDFDTTVPPVVVVTVKRP